MKQKLFSVICFILILLFLFSSCSSLAPSTEPETKETATEEMKGKNTEEKQHIQKGDPKDDDVINILMIGNSFSYYYVEELYGIAKAAGIKMRVCNLHYSGCRLNQHWEWYRRDENNYSYYSTTEKGRVGQRNTSFSTALLQENWDIISLQQHFGTNVAFSYDKSLDSCTPYDKKLYDMLKESFPLSQLYWHQTWAYQVGYDRGDTPVNSTEEQTTCYENIRSVSQKIAMDNNVSLVPSGDAWQIARANPAIGDNLCARLGINNDKGDNYHDGDIGGGQYLNACVWFETLTGQCCIGNKYRPNYDLSEEKILALQQAAHAAVVAR